MRGWVADVIAPGVPESILRDSVAGRPVRTEGMVFESARLISDAPDRDGTSYRSPAGLAGPRHRRDDLVGDAVAQLGAEIALWRSESKPSPPPLADVERGAHRYWEISTRMAPSRYGVAFTDSVLTRPCETTFTMLCPTPFTVIVT
jgi:hypothetical protein